MSDLKKDKEPGEIEIKDIQYTDQIPKEALETESPKEEHLAKHQEDLEFISEETVKDKSKMAEGKPISHEFVSRKKTLRRGVDEQEAKKEKTMAFCKNNLSLIGIGCLVVIVIICLIFVGVRTHKAKKAQENKNQPISTQAYEKDEYQEINTLIENYYAAYAEGDLDTLIRYASPMTDKEKSYITVYSQYVERYDNIVCYTKTGADDTSYIVSVALDVKFKDVDTEAPGLDFFYVRTSENGEVYIDNVYSQFNLQYQENALDDTISQLIASYQTGEDVVALLASVQTRYEAALEQDENLRNMVENTLIQAIADWSNQQAQVDEQNRQEAQAQVEGQESEDTPSEEETTEPAAAENTSETEQKAWVYATDGINIRESADENSAVLASATKGSELRQLAVTEDGWSKVKTGEIVGYARTEYLSEQKPESSSSTASLEEGTRIYLTETVNVRESMSESANRVGVAYAGDTVTVVMSYDEGWTKVNWDGKIGYIKTEVLSGM
jgi:hypothetical protein